MNPREPSPDVSTQENHAQRRFTRADVDFPVTIIVSGNELILLGRALDISSGGMRVGTSTDLPAGQPIVLRFTLPESNREMLVRARVVLSFYDAARKSFAHGIAFTQYAPHDFEAITAFVRGA